MYVPVSHVSRHLLSRPDSGLLSAASDVTRAAMGLGNSVGSWHTLETPSLHHSLEPTVNAETLYIPSEKFLHC